MPKKAGPRRDELEPGFRDGVRLPYDLMLGILAALDLIAQGKGQPEAARSLLAEARARMLPSRSDGAMFGQ